MKEREFHRVVIGRNPDARADPVNRVSHWRYEDKRHRSGEYVENQMGQRQTLALKIRTKRSDDRGNRGADIRADRERKRVLVADLTCRERCQDQHHRGVA